MNRNDDVILLRVPPGSVYSLCNWLFPARATWLQQSASPTAERLIYRWIDTTGIDTERVTTLHYVPQSYTLCISPPWSAQGMRRSKLIHEDILLEGSHVVSKS
jgi:hypothetical protein